ncbi:MAG: hypothetical protein KC931_24350, partial [Candidatus Omnitrophica bacterium]|nr:hypothetical protein [Candidatus Omnitrophota bacterium]
SAGGQGVTGLAADGEVEDYQVSIVMGTPPSLSCADINVTNDPGMCSAEVAFSPSATAVPPADVECFIGDAMIVSPYLFPVGETIVNCTATNQLGTDTCSFTVTVNDTENPVASCRDAMLSLDENGEATLLPGEVDNGSTDNCGVAMLETSPMSFSCGDLGENQVVLKVIDSSGNISTCTPTVTVVDDLEPVVAAPNLDPLSTSGGAEAALPDYRGEVVAVDNCTPVGSLVVGQTPSPGSMVSLGNVSVVFTVTDQSGNVGSGTSTLSVQEGPNYDIRPNPLDGKIDGRDLVGWYERIRGGTEEADLLFDFSRFWFDTAK